MPGPDQLTQGLARVAATSDENRLPGTSEVRRRGEQRTRRRRAAVVAATVCLVGGTAIAAPAVLGGGAPRTVPATPAPTSTDAPAPAPSTTGPTATGAPSPTTTPAAPSTTAPPATTGTAAPPDDVDEQWPEALAQLEQGTDVWLVLLAVAPPRDPALDRAAQRWVELTPYASDPRSADLTWIQPQAASDPGVVAACPAVVDSPSECVAQQAAFATQADAERFIELYADPVHGPFPWNTGSLD